MQRFTLKFWRSCSLLALMLACLCFTASAQQAITVKGVVTAKEDGAPAPGVTITIKNTTKGVSTDAEGKYSIQASVGVVLVFKAVGYETHEATVTGATLNIALDVKQNNLNEVVVIGYGTTTRQNITTAVSKVDPKDIPQAANSSIGELLFGRAPGLKVTQSSTQPGGGISISIRGRGTPLFVVDGVIYPGSGLEPSNGSISGTDGVNRGGLAGLNPEDIESIEVLKDAAAAIYGVAASNGVVLITTKKGKMGKMNITYDGNYSVIKNQPYLKPLNATQYETLYNQLTIDQYLGQHLMAPYGTVATAGVPAPFYSAAQIAAAGEGTDWLGQIFRSGSVNNHNVNINGGTDKTTYYFSGGYYNQSGVLKGSGVTKYTGRTNLSFKLTKFLTLNTNFTGNSNSYINSSSGGQTNGSGSQGFGIVQAALGYPTNVPIRNDNGSYYQFGVISNPVSLLDVSDNTVYHSLAANTSLDAKFIPGVLTGHLLFGDNYETATRSFAVPGTVFYQQLNLQRASLNNQNRENYTLEGTVNYKQDFFKRILNIDAVVGTGQYKNTFNQFSAQGSGAPDTYGTTNLSAETGNLGIGSGKTANTKRSYFGRASFTLLDRYLMSVSLREDGDSFFFPEHKYAAFPAVSIGWKINEESFMKNFTAIDLLKIRGSIGITGQTIGSAAYGYFANDGNGLFFNEGNTTYLTIAAGQNNLPDLNWQKTINKNIGLDFGLFKDRITGSVDFFKDDITQLLSSPKAAPLSLYATVQVNSGHNFRQGYDIGVNTQNVRMRDFSWNSTINVSHYEYKWVTRTINSTLQSYQDPTDPVNEVYYFKTNGIIKPGQVVPASQPTAGGASLPGSPLILDVNGDGKLDAADVFKLNPDPKIILGFGNNFRYKQFDLGIFFYGQFGGSGNNPNYAWADPTSIVTGTQSGDIQGLDAWTSVNQTATRPSVNYVESAAGLLVGTNINRVSTNFVRCRNLTLGYTLNSATINKFARSLRVFVDVQNLFIITNYKGVDPEVTYNGVKGGFAPYPQTKTFSFGVRAAF
ncbi:MAG: SusC/RagA family TonB-linked outer membrane protein [Bacteroidota bacterium]